MLLARNDGENLSDGTFSLVESAIPRRFYFYRNDGEVLGDADYIEAMKLYQAYVVRKIMRGEIIDRVPKPIFSQKSDDGRYIIIAVSNGDDDDNDDDGDNDDEQKPSPISQFVENPKAFFSRTLTKIFG